VNKTAAFICFAALAAVGLIGSVVLAIHRPDATATFTGLIVTVLGLAASAAGTFYALGKQGEKLETQSEQLTTIGKNVNGNQTRLLDTVQLQQEQIAALLAALPANGVTVPVDVTPPISEDTILRLRDDAAQLPSHRAGE
jgi:hypothetical protein